MSFSQILGQKRAKKFLTQVIAGAKIPHAYLFTGIPGIGKSSTAVALSMALNCSAPIDNEGCRRCKPCRQVMSGNFPDFLSMKPEGQNIKIEQIRELNRRLSFAPVSASYRVCVIRQAETMTREAANSFLKALEEPPPGNILILNTTEPRDLLPTIVSRCQRVPFQPLPVQDIAEWLISKSGLDEEKAKVLAKISGGSLGRALKMSEGEFLEKRQEWLSRLIGLPALSQEKSLGMAFQCVTEDKGPGLDFTESGESSMTHMLAIWKTWYRDLLLVKEQVPSHLLINVDFSRKLKSVAGSFKMTELSDSLLTIDQAQRDLRENRNATLVMEHTILRLKQLVG